MSISIIDLLGYIGTLFLVIAYALLNKKTPANKNLLYFLNLFGSFGVGFNAYCHKAMPGVVINVVWTIITLHAIYLHNVKNKILMK